MNARAPAQTNGITSQVKSLFRQAVFQGDVFLANSVNLYIAVGYDFGCLVGFVGALANLQGLTSSPANRSNYRTSHAKALAKGQVGHL